MSTHNPVARAINSMFEEHGRWAAFTRFLDDGRICLANNAAERALRGIALGRKAWLFAGSPRGGERAAFMYSLIVTAKMNDVYPQAWLADVLARLADTRLSRLPELLPWNWTQAPQRIGIYLCRALQSPLCCHTITIRLSLHFFLFLGGQEWQITIRTSSDNSSRRIIGGRVAFSLCIHPVALLNNRVIGFLFRHLVTISEDVCALLRLKRPS